MSTKKKCDLIKIILKILTQRKKLSTNLQDTRGFQYTRLMRQKADAIFIGEKITEITEPGTEIINCENHHTGKFWGADHRGCSLRYKIPKAIPEVFHNGSTYDYHFIIKQLTEKCEGEFKCLGENTEKYITFSLPLKKENDDDKIITYKLKFIDSYRFMSTSLSNLADNLSGIYFKECKKCMERKKIGLHYEFIRFQNDRLNYRCKECKHSCYKSKLKQFKIFRLCINFAIVISINFFCF